MVDWRDCPLLLYSGALSCRRVPYNLGGGPQNEAAADQDKSGLDVSSSMLWKWQALSDSLMI